MKLDNLNHIAVVNVVGRNVLTLSQIKLAVSSSRTPKSLNSPLYLLIVRMKMC